MSLRRSARAPTTQPTPNARQATNSSASSVSSDRPDRTSRSNPKSGSPASSALARSKSPEDPAPPADELPRRTRSSNEDSKGDRVAPTTDKGEHELEIDEEEEETRCICGQQEYPGLPMTSNEHLRRKSQVNSDPLSEDATGWFIQCDECEVWQHGGCVGILDEAQSPEKYFCEQCRKDLHEVSQDLNGRSFSRYLPAQESSSIASSPELKNKNNSKRTREGKPTRHELETLAKGRRATMNSRDSAYDETEQLRRAIEESKKDSLVKSNGLRKGKRGRSESEEREDEAKRRRTTSGSSSGHSKQPRQRRTSDEEAEKIETQKNMRGAVARNHRAKEVRDRDTAREKERAEASKEKNSNHKRKTDDLHLSPEPISKIMPSRGVGPTSRTSQTAAASKSHKKGGRPPARKGRLGRNQYSKDREPQNQTTHSPRSNNSQDRDMPNGHGGAHVGGAAESNGLGKPSRPRHMNPNRTTVNDMKRRVAGILEFISHTQVEMASLDAARSRSGVQNNNQTGTSAQSARQEQEKAALKHDLSRIMQVVGDMHTRNHEAFTGLDLVETMEVLTRDLMRWQETFGKYGDK